MPELQWRLKALMEQHAISGAQLHHELVNMGIRISRSQTYRLIAKQPAIIRTALFAGLCAVLRCEPSDLLPLARQTFTKRTLSMPPPPANVFRQGTRVQRAR